MIVAKYYNPKQINQYLKYAGKDILSSVGCYQAEKLGPQIIKSIRGDFFNVLGFPLFPFLSFLKKYFFCKTPILSLPKKYNMHHFFKPPSKEYKSHKKVFFLLIVWPI